MGYPIVNVDGMPPRFNPKIKVMQKINEHVKVYLTGVLTGSQTEKYTEYLDDGIGMVVSYENDDHKRTLLFKGLVTQFGLNRWLMYRIWS